MPRKYLGELPKHDPLHDYLTREIFPQVGHQLHHPDFRVFRMHGSNNKVYLYEEKQSQAKVVAKFFRDERHHAAKSAKRAQKEFHNLMILRLHGFASSPLEVVKPLAYNEHLNQVLIEEYIPGDHLGKILEKAIFEENYEEIYHKLSLLAYFLASMHNRTGNGYHVDFNHDCHYFSQLIEHLKTLKGLSHPEAQYFMMLCHQWKDNPIMWLDQQVLVHGDATPTNFIFDKENHIIAIDLERMKYGDRIFDIGRIVGEIQHYFMKANKHKLDAESFIGHFLWEYTRHFPNQNAAFHAITARLPFQIAITLMRIARNPWVSHEYGTALLQEAKKTLGGH